MEGVGFKVAPAVALGTVSVTATDRCGEFWGVSEMMDIGVCIRIYNICDKNM